MHEIVKYLQAILKVNYLYITKSKISANRNENKLHQPTARKGSRTSLPHEIFNEEDLCEAISKLLFVYLSKTIF